MVPKTRNGLTFATLILVLLTFSLAGWYAATRYANAQTVTYVIPRGTSERLAAGQEVVRFPNELVFTVGDTIVIDNQDDAVHSFGPFTILPQTTLTKRFTTARVYQNSCTFHQDRQMRLVVSPAAWGLIQ